VVYVCGVCSVCVVCGYVFVCVCVCVCVLLGIESRALFMLHVKRDKTEIYYIIKIF
jgi:hypothetical protein